MLRKTKTISQNHKIDYITVKAPFGKKETFVIAEMLALKELGVDLLIIPRDRTNKLFHKRAQSLLNNTLIIPWFNFQIAKEFLKYLVKTPISFFKIINHITLKTRSIRIAIKNLTILPKSLFLSKIFRDESIVHIHAHWGSTTSTMAYVISKITKIPWSFTLYRWDIDEDNMVKEKVKSALFARTIDERGREEIISKIKDITLIKKISVIHMGVDIPEINESPDNGPQIFTFLCPANLVLKKGHKYLFKACKILSDNGLKYKCLIAGSGPLEDELKNMIRYLKLNNYISFLGHLPNERLLGLYNSGRVNAVVLASIVTEDGEKEGIPVALMEAMSYGIPVISTNTGGISELISNGNGILVDEKDPESIATAIVKLMKDKTYYNLIRERGRKKIEREFNLSIISKKLLRLFLECNHE